MAPGGGCRIQRDRPVMSGGGYETQRGKAFAQSDSDFPWLYRALNRDLPSALPLRPVWSCPLFSLLSVQGCPHESGHHAVCSLLDGDPSTPRSLDGTLPPNFTTFLLSVVAGERDPWKGAGWALWACPPLWPEFTHYLTPGGVGALAEGSVEARSPGSAALCPLMPWCLGHWPTACFRGGHTLPGLAPFGS